MSDEPACCVKTSNHSVTHAWTAKETGWLFSHIGTGIGAGLLYLPIAAGSGGAFSLLLMVLVSGPIVLLSHRGLTRFCLASQCDDGDLGHIVRSSFGEKIGRWLVLLCFLSMFPVLLLYSIGITNVTESYFQNQLGIVIESRSLLAFGLITMMVVLFCSRESLALSILSSLVFPLIIVLLCLALYLIPQWRLDFISQPFSLADSLKSFFLILPVLVFSFYHAPISPTFSRSYLRSIKDIHRCIAITDKVHFRSSALLLLITLFFVFSCLMALTPDQIHQARTDNLPVLSVLANQPDNRFLSATAPIIAFVSILTSFFGFFIGTVEMMNGFLVGVQGKSQQEAGHYHRVSILLIIVSCWIAATCNWSVLSVIELIVAPMMAIILFFIPVIGLRKKTAMRMYWNRWSDLFVLITGSVVIAGFAVSLIL
ncbi:serine transporter [Endozoicomonas sp. OPT23]|uniref:amino acid permease n=1 Tax=Endozoicomonas sp. OPT23 TaxID=2072845 RepID=UPI00129A9BE3|nr:aromatic amino acid transport family protein [Endozoicomonas sp. OPT23]MRI32949.1 serine transporter [Endozoicomonas sp. OPT23]